MIQREFFFQEPDYPSPLGKKRAIEHGFPIALVSKLAAHESWRKEVYRPLSYIHKWWARRLGSVFRAILIASNLGEDDDVASLLWQPLRFPDVVVYDPFMGSGVTVHEAVKLGCRVIGRDINPVASTMVHTALQPYDRAEVQATFDTLAHTVGSQIQSFYQQETPAGEMVDVLYYFWVKVVCCPGCGSAIDLLKSRVFARHAYPARYPAAHALCPDCGAVNDIDGADTRTVCTQCGTAYNPQNGNVVGKKIVCPVCTTSFKLIDVVRQRTTPLDHRMYAKLVLHKDGTKTFLPVDKTDHLLYEQATALLPSVWHRIPQSQIAPGYNTNQILNYHYAHWHQMFNARQLATLGLLADGIACIEEPALRQLFACLFSGILEFNTMFASFKGIGTGAVRPLFSHHILKPELTPLEANPWGTSKSSGSFRTLFASRILRVLDYKARPFEFRIGSNGRTKTAKKLYQLATPMNTTVAQHYQEFAQGANVYLSTGDSAATDIAAETVDVIVTDPPFFDNVHYSQLADFFYVWQQSILKSSGNQTQVTTRHPDEVQHTDAQVFTHRLTAVLCECNRVLKHTGLMVFTYHHTRAEGWEALYHAVRTAGFVITRTYPVKAEMAVSVVLQQTKVPINIDLIIVCRKSEAIAPQPPTEDVTVAACLPEARETIAALQQAGLPVSRGDVRVVLIGCLLARLARLGNLERERHMLKTSSETLHGCVEELLGDG